MTKKMELLFPNTSQKVTEITENGDEILANSIVKKFAIPTNVIDPESFTAGVQASLFEIELSNLNNKKDRAEKALATFKEKREKSGSKVAQLSEREYQESLDEKEEAIDDLNQVIEMYAQEYLDWTESNPDITPDLFQLISAGVISGNADFSSPICMKMYVHIRTSMQKIQKGQRIEQEDIEKLEQFLNAFLKTDRDHGDGEPIYRSKKIKLSKQKFFIIVSSIAGRFKWTEDGIIISNLNTDKARNVACRQALFAALQHCFGWGKDKSVTKEIAPRFSI